MVHVYAGAVFHYFDPRQRQAVNVGAEVSGFIVIGDNADILTQPVRQQQLFTDLIITDGEHTDPDLFARITNNAYFTLAR